MTTDPVTLARKNDLTEAVELLVEQKIGDIPVVDQAEGLLGIVTYIDLLHCFLNRLQEDYDQRGKVMAESRGFARIRWGNLSTSSSRALSLFRWPSGSTAVLQKT